MPSRLPRKFRLAIEPPVQAVLSRHRVTFDGLNFLRPHVMVEYRADPPVSVGPAAFGPKILTLRVVDDTSSEPYPTAWEDFDWSVRGPGRMTTRLEQRPPAKATQLSISVLSLEPTSAQRVVASFAVKLPRDHALPWDENSLSG
jgi:hypothetical protein